MTARRLVGLLRPHRMLIAAVVVLGLAWIGLNLLGPKLLGYATDLIFAGLVSTGYPAGSSKEDVIGQLRADGRDTLANVFSTTDLVPGEGVDFGALGVVLLVLLGIYLVAAGFMLWRGRLVATIVQRVVRNLRAQVDAKLSRLPMSHFDRNSGGDVLSRATNDIDNLQQSFQLTLGQLINSVFTILGVLAVMLVISPALALIVLLSVPLAAAIAWVISKRAQPRFAEQWGTTGSLNAHIEQIYTGHSLVKGFGRRELAEREFDEHNEALYRAGSRAQFITGMIEPAARFVTDLNYVLVAVVGALRVASGSLSIGDVQAFIQYSQMFSRPIVDLANFSGQLQSGLASAKRIFELLDAEEQRPDAREPVRPGPTRGQVVFDRVSFRYLPGKPLIEDLSLIAEPGQVVAIVGPTGAGKTTLGNLLMRFYELDGGRILLDGEDIASMDREDLRSRIGLVSQDAWLFHGTIAENIAYGRPDATRAEVIAAAEATCVDRFVHTLPDGYDTVLDDETSTVSAGEKQLITLARAFLIRPSLLVLDEATSSIDTKTEELVQRATSSLRAGRTCFVIAHRLSTVRNADLIVVMENGQLIERGTHTELLEADGTYARLHAASSATPVDLLS
ncbi:putative ABC transporter ATP-binding protein [Amycolatopsis sp. YIM 10]|nr:putative ABC transporter ATP-binding protein [Amycolatopsis sp. YIM 10]